MIQTDKYTFEWTIPQCVLTLRLIAITFDIYDGQRIKNQEVTKEVISRDIVENSALLETPSFLEILSISFFPSSFLVGPQFEARRFLKFYSNEKSSLNIT
jgi:PREDICTED: similar to MGC81123 protein